MDKDTWYALNDLTDVVKELAKLVAELNPGANMGLIESKLARIDRQLTEIHDATEKIAWWFGPWWR